MKKAFDQTVRDIKREVNKKVLKVPSIEQKVLDATSNEPWGPHGSLLADIAQASRNYHEYQITMSIIWKRINDTGKNWRHVYKGLTVLEYLVANGSERVIDDIKEHGYQISTLSEFQYIDSSGKDQGNNVRKKSQSLVILVNDKERIQEARLKASANKDKFRNTSKGNVYRPSIGGYGDRYDEDRYGSRNDDRGGYGGYKDGRDSDDRYGREDYKHDDNHGRKSFDDQQYSSRSSDRERDDSYEGDSQYSSRGNGAKVDDNSQDGSKPDMKYSEQNFSAPPSYEEAVGEVKSPVRSERDGETSAASAPRTYSPPVESVESSSPALASASPAFPEPSVDNDDSRFDQFDPRGFAPAPRVSSNGAEIDFLGSLTEAFSSEALAVVPVSSSFANSEADAFSNPVPVPTFAASQPPSTFTNQNFDDPFGDGPFQAHSSTASVPTQSQQVISGSSSIPVDTFNNNSFETPQNSFSTLSYAAAASSVPNVHHPSSEPQFLHQEHPISNQDNDILADILPLAGPSFSSPPQTGFPGQVPTNIHGFPVQAPTNNPGFPVQAPTNNPGLSVQAPSNIPGFPVQAHTNISGFQVQAPTNNPGFPVQAATNHPGFPVQAATNHPGFPVQAPTNHPGFPVQAPTNIPGFPVQALTNIPGFPVQAQQPTSVIASQGHQSGFTTQNIDHPSVDTGFLGQGSGQTLQSNANFYGNHQQPPQYYMGSQPPPVMPQSTHSRNNPDPRFQISPQIQSNTQMSSQVSLSTTPSSTTRSLVVSAPSQPAAKDKFEPKSTVWADTLSRGLVNLNIYGSKTNPLADIGVDFDAINRKEKRMEKSSTTTSVPPSLVNMGKAMGSGSGLGRSGPSSVRPPPPNPMMGGPPGMVGRPGQAMAMGNYGYTMQPPPQTGFPPRPMTGGYSNTMMGGLGGGYMHQQPPPYGGGNYQ